MDGRVKREETGTEGNCEVEERSKKKYTEKERRKEEDGG